MNITTNLEFVAALEEMKTKLENLIFQVRIKNDTQIMEYDLMNDDEKQNVDMAGLTLENERLVKLMLIDLRKIKQNILVIKNVINTLEENGYENNEETLVQIIPIHYLGNRNENLENKENDENKVNEENTENTNNENDENNENVENDQNSSVFNYVDNQENNENNENQETNVI